MRAKSRPLKSVPWIYAHFDLLPAFIDLPGGEGKGKGEEEEEEEGLEGLGLGLGLGNEEKSISTSSIICNSTSTLMIGDEKSASFRRRTNEQMQVDDDVISTEDEEEEGSGGEEEEESHVKETITTHNAGTSTDKNRKHTIVMKKEKKNEADNDNYKGNNQNEEIILKSVSVSPESNSNNIISRLSSDEDKNVGISNGEFMSVDDEDDDEINDEDDDRDEEEEEEDDDRDEEEEDRENNTVSVKFELDPIQKAICEAIKGRGGTAHVSLIDNFLTKKWDSLEKKDSSFNSLAELRKNIPSIIESMAHPDLKYVYKHRSLPNRWSLGANGRQQLELAHNHNRFSGSNNDGVGDSGSIPILLDDSGPPLKRVTRSSTKRLVSFRRRPNTDSASSNTDRKRKIHSEAQGFRSKKPRNDLTEVEMKSEQESNKNGSSSLTIPHDTIRRLQALISTCINEHDGSATIRTICQYLRKVLRTFHWNFGENGYMTSSKDLSSGKELFDILGKVLRNSSNYCRFKENEKGYWIISKNSLDGSSLAEMNPLVDEEPKDINEKKVHNNFKRNSRRLRLTRSRT